MARRRERRMETRPVFNSLSTGGCDKFLTMPNFTAKTSTQTSKAHAMRPYIKSGAGNTKSKIMAYYKTICIIVKSDMAQSKPMGHRQ